MTTPSDVTQLDPNIPTSQPVTDDDRKLRIAWLEKEQQQAASDAERALLCFESAVTRQRMGDQAGAAKDYLDSYNANPAFREPVEALTVLLERRKSLRNLGRLFETLTAAATTPLQAARANLLKGGHLVEIDEDLDGAKASFEQAVLEQPDLAAGWLELEIIGGKTNDSDLRLRALQQRARLAEPAGWKALLLLDLASELSTRGDFDAALDCILEAAQLDSPYKFRAFSLLETIAVRQKRADLVADALVFQAELVLNAMGNDAVANDSVPSYVQTVSHVADLFVRASKARIQHGDLNGAVSLLDVAMSKLPKQRAVCWARFEAAQLVGDVETASSLAQQLLEQDANGPGAIVLWMAVFEEAAASADRQRAAKALQGALACDPSCAPARALQVDLLMDADPGAFAAAIEAMAEQNMADEGKAQVYLLAAWAWATLAKDVTGAKAALEQAAMFGAGHGDVSRLSRAFATALDDDAWYEEATKRLTVAGATPAEHASLWFELVRKRLLRGDGDIQGAITSLSQSQGGAWLARILSAYALAMVKAGKLEQTGAAADAQQTLLTVEPLEQLAIDETDPATSCALSVVAVLRRLQSGDRQGALQKLRELHETHPHDLLVGVLVADLERDQGNARQAASVLVSCAMALDDDPQMSVTLRLEAALLLWRTNERDAAIEHIKIAKEQLPEHAFAVLLWALAARDPDSLASRRQMVEAGELLGSDSVETALMRFAVESSEGGDEDAATQALSALENDAVGSMRVAAWLGRLIQAPTFEDATARARALDGLEQLGLRASAVVAAERYRFVRTVEKDRDAARDYGRAWATADGGVGPAIEWLTASVAAEDVASQAAALRLLGQHVPKEASSSLNAHAALLEHVRADGPSAQHGVFVQQDGVAVQLANLELAPAGCDPRRRAKALLQVTDELGEQASKDAKSLAGWSLLASGQHQQAFEVFKAVCDARPDDLVAWEGVRTAAVALGDVHSNATACERLGALCKNDSRAAEFYETAGLLWLDEAKEPERGEAALASGFERDGRRFVCFDRLFRRVRARKDNDYLLELIARRLQYAEDTAEIAKMFWERARALREKGEFEGAMAALDSVTMLEPDHVGALALSGEMAIREQKFDIAAEKLAILAGHHEAPAQQRLVSGMAAVDLYENKLSDSVKAMEVLTVLHTTGLSNAVVRERLAKLAVQIEAWPQAVEVFELLMNDREDSEGRRQAALEAMVIYRDKLSNVSAALPAIERLLQEQPADPDGLDMLLANEQLGKGAVRKDLLDKARVSLVQRVSHKPQRTDVKLLSRLALEQNDMLLRQACLGACVATGCAQPQDQKELDNLDERIISLPKIVIDDVALARIAHPSDSGAISKLFSEIGPLVADALGPTLVGLEVSKKDRIDPRDGVALRNDIAHWAGALGISDFELYVGGRDPRAVVGVPGERPMLVVGNDIKAPLSVYARQAVARELFGIRRGISVVRTRDKLTVACVVVGLCNVLGVSIEAPPYAMLAETQRLMSRVLPRRLRRPLTELCQAVAQSGEDPKTWYSFALASLDRMAAIAAGDVSVVLADALDVGRDRLETVVSDDARARQLVGFVLSDGYLELRKQLGMGVR